MSEAVFGKASSGNGEDEHAVLHVQRQHLLERCCQEPGCEEPTRRNADALRESVIKERRVWGVVDEVRRMGGDDGKIRRAPQEVGKGRCPGGAADIDGSAQSRGQDRDELDW